MKENSLVSHSLKWGLIIGGINLVITLLMYLIDVSLMTSIPISGLLFVINISLVVYAGIVYRRSIGGYVEFKTMLITIFLIFLVSSGVGTIFQIALYGMDPELKEQVIEAGLESTENILDFFGTPPDMADEQLEEAEADLEESLTTVGMIKSWAWGWIVAFILALIIAAILKKNKPVFEQD